METHCKATSTSGIVRTNSEKKTNKYTSLYLHVTLKNDMRKNSVEVKYFKATMDFSANYLYF